MKTISSGMSSHLSEEVTTLCTCWKIVRQDGQVFGFTDHDMDLTFSASDLMNPRPATTARQSVGRFVLG
jgi:hypothetical protein